MATNIVIFPKLSRIAFTSTNDIVQDIIQTAAGAIVVSGSTGTSSFDNGALTLSSSVTATNGNFSLGTVGGAIGSVKNLTVSNSNGAVGDWAGLNFAYYNNTTNFAYIGSVLTSDAGNSKSDLVFGVKSSTSSTVVTEYMRIQSGGNIGVGTANPSYQLDLGGGATVNQRLRLQRGTDDSSQNGLYGWNSITVERTSVNITDPQTDFSIIQKASNGSRTTFYISASSNIGIGTTTPSTPLDVFAGSDATTNTILWGQTIRNEGNGVATGYGAGLKLKISNDGTPNEVYKWAGIAAVAGTSYSNRTDLALYTNTSSTSSATEKVRITGDGLVGINTTAPASRVSINDFLGGALPYLDGTSNSFSFNGYYIGQSNSDNTGGIVGGLVLQNNTYAVNAYSPVIGFMSRSSNGAYSNTYAAIFGQATGIGGDANWTKGQLIFQTSDAYGPVTRLTISSTGAATFSSSVGASSAAISSTSISTNASTSLLSSRGIIVDAATTTNSAFIPIGFSWASSISNYNPYWGMALKTVNYNAGTADLVFYTGGNVRLTIGDAGGATFNGSVNGDSFYSTRGTVSVASSTATTFFTPTDVGLYIAHVFLSGNATQTWDASIIFMFNTSNILIINQTNGVNVSTSVSGTNIQVTQIGGSTYNFNYDVIKIR